MHGRPPPRPLRINTLTKKSIPPSDDKDPAELFDDTPAKEDPAPDPFDPESLRLDQDFGSSLGVRKVLTVVRARKPTRQEFVRVRPGAEWRLETAAFEDKMQRETYLVDKCLWSDLSGEIQPVVLFLAINRQSDVFLWPVKLPGTDGRTNSWLDSALAAAQLAERVWVRMAANMAAGLYDTFQASGDLADPEWPELTFPELLRLCFKDRFIRSADHPMLRQLRGEA